MKIYDPEVPLIFSHIPKSGGTTLRAYFEHWFGASLQRHYPGPVAPTGTLWMLQPGTRLVYGHFNRARGWDIADYLKQSPQFVTMVREPWERVVSGYFYRRKFAGRNPVFRKVAATPLEQYLANWPYDDPDMGPPMSNFLPRIPEPDAVAEILERHCVAVGVLESFEASVTRYGQCLGKPAPAEAFAHRNAAERDLSVPSSLREEFYHRNRLEVAIYDWGRSWVYGWGPR